MFGNIAPPFKGLAEWCLHGTHRLWRAGCDFLYPRLCAFCGAEHGIPDEGKQTGPAFCLACRSALWVRMDHSCNRCGAPVGPFLETSNGCQHCRRDRFAFETVIPLGVYGGLLRTACLRAKQAGRQPLAAALGELLWQAEEDALRRAPFDCVLPVPHHWTQRLRHGHNPAAILAHVLARRLNVKFSEHILVKVRRTAAQTSLSASQRRTNLRGAFRVRWGKAVRGGSVLLVDDVLTTGTTAHEAAKVLRRAGVERVVVAVLARGLGQ